MGEHVRRVSRNFVRARRNYNYLKERKNVKFGVRVQSELSFIITYIMSRAHGSNEGTELLSNRGLFRHQNQFPQLNLHSSVVAVKDQIMIMT